MQTEELLPKVQDMLKQENLTTEQDYFSENDPRLTAAAIEIAGESKSILGGLYYDFRKADTNTARKIKNKVIGKIANIVRNTLERPLITQQKFNEQIYYLVTNLIAENKKLKQELDQLKKHNNNE
jgi:hypothetical protein